MIQSGIEPVPYNLEKEREQFACMIAFYANEQGAPDFLSVFSKCVDMANAHDFELEDDKMVIDTEEAMIAAKNYAKEIVSLIKDPTSEETLEER